MKFNKIILISFIILSVFMLSAVSAQENTTAIDESEINEIDNVLSESVYIEDALSDNLESESVLSESVSIEEDLSDNVLSDDVNSEVKTGSEKIYFDAHVPNGTKIYNIYVYTPQSVGEKISIYLDGVLINESIKFDDEDYYVEMEDYIDSLELGNHSISFYYPGNERFAPSNITYNFVKTPISTYIPKINWGDESSFFLSRSSKISDNYTITILVDKKVYKTYNQTFFNDDAIQDYDDDNYLFPWDVSYGTHDIEVIYQDENITYSESGKFTNSYFDISIEDGGEYGYGDLYLNLYCDDGKYSNPLVVKISDKTYKLKMSSYEDSIIIPKKLLKLGENKITLSYAGDKKHPALKRTVTFNIIHSFTFPYDVATDETGTVYVGVPSNSKGTLTVYKVIETERFDVKLEKIKTVSAKSSYFNLPKLKAGEYNFIIKYDDGKNNTRVYEDYYVNVAKNTKGFKASVTPKTVKYKNEITIKITSPVKDYASIYVDGKEFKEVYLKKGTNTVKIIIPTSGKHDVKITYNDYDKKFFSKSFKVTVKKATSYITLKKVTVKKSAKKLTLTATVKKVNGKAIKGKKVTFKFNGKTYKAKTNKKGVAKVTIKKSVLKKLKAGKTIKYQASYQYTVKKSAKVKK